MRAAIARACAPAARTRPGPAPRPPPALTRCGGGGALPETLSAPGGLRAPLLRRGPVPRLPQLQTGERASGPPGPGRGRCGGRKGWRPPPRRRPLHPASNRPRAAAALPGHRARPHARRPAPARRARRPSPRSPARVRCSRRQGNRLRPNGGLPPRNTQAWMAKGLLTLLETPGSCR